MCRKSKFKTRGIVIFIDFLGLKHSSVLVHYMSYLIFLMTIKNTYKYCPHFPDEEIELWVSLGLIESRSSQD